tara:strand:- start:250 stop:1227 length:978 start_codon:yes stop_codon:yes gene_type:complete
MFNTKNLVREGSDVPSYWAFQYYLNLSETLTGQDVKIKSIFNPNEKTPSFCIYVDKNIMQYKFKDFSTGKMGNKTDLVMAMFDISYTDAMNKVVNDYNIHIKSPDFKEQTFKPVVKWKIDYIKTRDWTIEDKKFWLSFRIGKTVLEEYNIKPIEYYNMAKEDNGEFRSLQVGSKWCYGYFDKNNEVYKIYQPFSKKHKFHKVKPYLQGVDQLKYNQPYLVICSSLKDAMCLKGMGYNLEVLAPDSENTMIKPHVIAILKKKYKKVITLFDNDEAGLKAVERYANAYKINGFVPTICKDISDAMKLHGFDKVHAMLKPLLKETLNK